MRSLLFSEVGDIDYQGPLLHSFVPTILNRKTILCSSFVVPFDWDKKKSKMHPILTPVALMTMMTGTTARKR